MRLNTPAGDHDVPRSRPLPHRGESQEFDDGLASFDSPSRPPRSPSSLDDKYFVKRFLGSVGLLHLYHDFLSAGIRAKRWLWALRHLPESTTKAFIQNSVPRINTAELFFFLSAIRDLRIQKHKPRRLPTGAAALAIYAETNVVPPMPWLPNLLDEAGIVDGLALHDLAQSSEDALKDVIFPYHQPTPLQLVIIQHGLTNHRHCHPLNRSVGLEYCIIFNEADGCFQGTRVLGGEIAWPYVRSYPRDATRR